jgi:alpha-1,3-mannosyltransferase
MKIIHVVRQFHPAVGGLEYVVLEIVKSQIAQGHVVKVVTLDRVFNATPQPRMPSLDTVVGAEVIRIPFFGSTRYPLAPSVIQHIGDADIVHVHAIDFFFDYLAWTKLLHRRSLVVSTHGGYFHTSRNGWLKKLYFSTITRASLTWYEGVAAISRSDYERFGTKRRRGLVCIENGIDCAKYSAASSVLLTKTIVSLGRLSTNKRLDRLILFFHALCLRDSQWRLKILGRPWDVDPGKLTELIERLGLQQVVEITSPASEADIRMAMATSSFAASASEYEGFGVAALEALSAGLYPVLNDIPPLRNLVERTGIGLLVDFSRPDASAAELIACWPKLEESYAEHRRSAMAASRQFDWVEVCKAYERLYEAAIGTRLRTILDIPIRVQTVANAVSLLDARFASGTSTSVAFANAHALNIAASDLKFHDVLRRCIVFNDGIGVDIASRLLYGARFPQNLNGSDFIPRYLQSTRHRFRMFLLGAKPGIAERATRYLTRLCPAHQIVGCHPGYFGLDDSPAVVESIRRTGASVILVGMGNPRQEFWLDDHLAATGCRLGVAVGALFDFLAGEVPRASDWTRAARLEWMYRLLCEPKRLSSRYILGNPAFLFRITGQWASGSRVPG